MEFRYRASDSRAAPEEEEAHRRYSSAYFPEPEFQGGRRSVRLMTDEMLHRELEKAKIWQEILVDEIERRKELMRKELRREMIGERDPLPVALQVGRAGGEGYLPPLSRCFVVPPPDPPPEVRPPSTPADVERNKAEKMVLLELPGRIRDLRQGSEKSGIGVGKEEQPAEKEELSCAVCKVNVTSHKQLVEHLVGKQHERLSQRALPTARGRKRRIGANGSKCGKKFSK